MVLQQILENPLYNKDIKPAHLKGNQPLTPDVSAEASTEGLKVERMDASKQNCLTVEAPSKEFIPLPLEETQKAWTLYVPWVPQYMRCIVPSSTGAQGRGILGPGGGGWLRDPLEPSLTK